MTLNQRAKKVIDVEFSGEDDLEAVAKAFELLGYWNSGPQTPTWMFQEDRIDQWLVSGLYNPK